MVGREGGRLVVTGDVEFATPSPKISPDKRVDFVRTIVSYIVTAIFQAQICEPRKELCLKKGSLNKEARFLDIYLCNLLEGTLCSDI